MMTDGSPDAILYRTEIRFNTICVIESLRPGDPKTGQDLYDRVILPGKVAHERMHAEFAAVSTKKDLLQRLERIAYAAETANWHPLLHLETHGDSDGIQLANGDVVAWAELIPHFTRINIACRNNLVVVAMSCFGWDLTTSLMPSARAPVMMLVGPPATMTAAELLDATTRFYDSLMVHFDVNRALEAMNEHRPFEEWPIRPATAEILFCRVFRMYMSAYDPPAARAARVNALLARLEARRTAGPLDKAALAIAVDLRLNNHRVEYERIRRRFLMLDLFPADVTRFGLTYDVCVPRMKQSGDVRE